MDNTITIPQIDWWAIAPICAVIGTGILALLLEMLRPKKTNNAIVLVSLAGLGVAAYTALVQFGMPDGDSFAGMVTRDRVGLILQFVLIGVAFVSILFSEGYLREKRISFGEFYPLALWSTAGAMIMVSTNNMLMLFIGLEVLSIALYVMAGLSRQESKSEESAIKYFLLGAFATGFLLYGIAFIYGATGGLQLTRIGDAWAIADVSTRNLLLFGVGLILVGLSFKSAFVPFHQWTPDVYQGAPTNVTAFMAAGSKIGAIGALYRVLDASLSLHEFWGPALFWIAIATMTVANFVACLQKDVKRILGYSSISNAGYVLVALLAHFNMPSKVSISTTVFYLISYSLMTIGAFAVVSLTAKSGKEGTRLQDLYGLYRRSPFAATALLIFVASLIGVPPTAGFVGKFLIFGDALTANLAPLAIVLAVNSAISCYYYLGIIKAVLVTDEPGTTNQTATINPGMASACVICLFGTLATSFFVTPILAWMGLN